MNVLKVALLGGTACIAFAATARAADLPIVKAPAQAKVNCYVDFWSWLNSSAQECPLGVSAITFYGAIDVGGSYQTHAAPFNRYYPNGVEAVVGKQSGGAAFVASPSNLSQSNIGIKGLIPLFSDVKFTYNLNAGFDPYSLQFANGPGSLVSQNGIPTAFQQSAGDSSRAGQWYNNFGWAGLTSDTYGTVKIGRQSTFSNDLIGAYDPTGGSYAFSLLGNSGTLGGGLGVTEVTRYNTAVQYVYDYKHLVHVGGMAQVGGLSDGNGASGAFQVNVGGAYKDFAIDGVYAHDRNALALATFAPTLPANFVSNDLKGTYANLDAFMLVAKYKYQQVTFSGGYENTRFSNPSAGDIAWDNSNVVTGQGSGYQVNPFIGTGPTTSVTTSAYNLNKILQTAWAGAKYSITPSLDLEGGYWHVWQNNYDATPATGCVTGYTISGTGPGTGYPKVIGQGAKSSDCAGSEDAASLVLDYRPVKRVDTYIGLLYSRVYGGFASNFAQSNNLAFTGGVRLNF
jgi:predicted porin